MINKKNIVPSNQILLRYSLVSIVLIFVITAIIPYLLNYPSQSILDINMSYMSHAFQFTMISLLCLFGVIIFIKTSFRDIDKWYKLPENEKYKNKDFLLKLRKKCFKLPYILFGFELLMPITMSIIVLTLTGNQYNTMIFKLLFLVISYSLFLSTLSFVFSKNLYRQILIISYNKNVRFKDKFPIYYKIILQLLPVTLIILFLTTLIGYSKAVSEKEEIWFKVYNHELTESFDLNKKNYTEQEIVKNLEKFQLYDDKAHNWFIITPENKIISNTQISEFMQKYVKETAPQYNGKAYDSYGKDIQAATIALESKNGTYYVGIVYNIVASIALTFLLYNFIFSLFLIIIMLHMFAKSFSNDLKDITNGLKNIAENNAKTKFDYLPVTSNDEMGELVHSFNDIQDLTKTYINEISDNHKVLIEKERLATLGQMISGIAHNMKTPIMSISGAKEALEDLVKEYDLSIGDKSVTEEDNHEIAKEMKEWLEKISNHLEYMSDIITTVKGQAVNMSDTTPSSFTIEETLKQVNILMKHELKNALITLNIDCQVEKNMELHGNLVSLIQVINNIISNAIQAYNGEPNQNIDMKIYKNNKNLVIEIKDYGMGISKAVQKKLFNSMITTKGKNGTGLGMFMSYSNIKAHFKGDITFESEKGKGTTFYIYLPIN